MTNWVDYQGYPMLIVKRIKEGYELTQERVVIVNLDVHPTKWWLPITYVEESNPNFSNTTPVDWLSPDNTSHIVPSKEKTGWKFDIFEGQKIADVINEILCSASGYYRVNYDKENWELLTKELNKGNNTKIHPVNRAQMIDDAFNLARTNSLNYTLALNVSLYLTHEADYIPWHTAFRHLSFLQNLLRTSDKYHTFMGIKQTSGLMIRHAVTTWRNFPGSSGLFEGSTCFAKPKTHFARWWGHVFKKREEKGEKPRRQDERQSPGLATLDINLKTEILCAGVRYANQSMWTRTLEYIIASALDDDNRKDLQEALACSNSSEILKKYLNSTLDPNYSIDFQTAAINVVSRHQTGPEIVFNFMLKEYEHIRRIKNFKAVVQDVALTIGGAITTEQQYVN
ncbi:aminopeptidase N-like, partial [Ceratina calcarata]|uniref:Aminopeptidase N-like n=1 Tax=Ceratina calcarata TaxID=156304 RepID=A0AAJ7WFV5_9HYME